MHPHHHTRVVVVAVEVVSEAEADVEKNAEIDILIKASKNQAELLLENLFSDIVEGKTITFSYM